MKNLILLSSLLFIYSCSTSNESERINDFAELIKIKYEYEIENSIVLVENTMYDKFNVKPRLFALDSLTRLSLKSLEGITSKEEARKILTNWRSLVTKKTRETVSSSNIDRLLGDSFYLSNVKYEILFQAREQAIGLSMEIGAQEIKFDQINSFVIPTNNVVKVGEKYKAQIFLVAYSSNIGEILEIQVNGLPIIIDKGIGYIEFTPTKKGKYSYTVDFVGTKNDQFLKPFSLKKEIEYVVK